MKQIKLTQGKFATVDNRDFEWLNQWKWRVSGEKVLRCELKNEYGNNKRGNRLMSREIMKHNGVNIKNLVVDHIDHNTFNNQMSNLRPATVSQNAANTILAKNNTSGYKGVYWSKQIKRWVARICVNKKNIHLGCSCNLQKMVELYDKKAKLYFGSYSLTNGGMNL